MGHSFTPLTSSRCRVCGTVLNVHDLGGVCRSLSCRTTLTIRANKLREAENRAAAIKAATALAEAHLDLGPVIVGAVPYSDCALVPADPERTAAFRSSLEQAICEALSGSECAEPAQQHTSDPIAGALVACGVCGGRCCWQGSTHAFLSAQDLASKFVREPPVSVEAVLQAYTSYLPDHSHEGSCVFHAEQGCALPRPMRSEVCNHYRCFNLAEFSVALEAAPGAKGFVAAIQDGEVRRVAIFDQAQAATPVASKDAHPELISGPIKS